MSAQARRLREQESGPRCIEGPRNRRKARRPDASAASRPPERALRDRMAALRASIGVRLAILRGPLVVIGRLAVVAAAIAGAIALLRVIERHVRTSAAFATRDIEIRGAARLEHDEIARIAGIQTGQNVFEVSPEEARRRLLASPWVAEAEVRRRLPSRWSIAVREHEPAALLALSGIDGAQAADPGSPGPQGLWLVSGEGAVFKRLEPGDPADLPVITGIDAGRFTADRGFRTRILLAIVALLSDWRASGLWQREPIAEIHVQPDGQITLRVGEDATEVRLGHAPYRPKLDRLRRVLDELDRRSARPAYVYLDNVRRPDRVVVRVR